jgi:hypothetical protein
MHDALFYQGKPPNKSFTGAAISLPALFQGRPGWRQAEAESDEAGLL